MIVINDNNGLQQLVADNPTKKIGKYLLDVKIFNQRKIANQNHYNIITALKDNGCDIIVFEVMNLEKLFSIATGSEYTPDETSYDHTVTINSFQNLDIDYLVFATTLDFTLTSEIENEVDSIITTEDYENVFQLTSIELGILKSIIIWTKLRSIAGETINGALLENAFYYHAWKHYRENYTDQKVIVVPMVYESTGKPITTNKPSILFLNDEASADVVEFSLYLKNLSNDGWLNQQNINSKAIELGGNMDYKSLSLTEYNVIHIVYTGVNSGQMRFEKLIYT